MSETTYLYSILITSTTITSSEIFEYPHSTMIHNLQSTVHEKFNFISTTYMNYERLTALRDWLRDGEVEDDVDLDGVELEDAVFENEEEVSVDEYVYESGGTATGGAVGEREEAEVVDEEVEEVEAEEAEAEADVDGAVEYVEDDVESDVDDEYDVDNSYYIDTDYLVNTDPEDDDEDDNEEVGVNLHETTDNLYSVSTTGSDGYPSSESEESFDEDSDEGSVDSGFHQDSAYDTADDIYFDHLYADDNISNYGSDDESEEESEDDEEGGVSLRDDWDSAAQLCPYERPLNHEDYPEQWDNLAHALDYRKFMDCSN